MLTRACPAMLAVAVVACSSYADTSNRAAGPASTPASPASSAPASAPLTQEATDAGTDAASPAPVCDATTVTRDTFSQYADTGTITYYETVANPRGIIVALHGTGGSSENLASESVEWATFFHEASQRGYDIVIPESLQREPPRQWDAISADGDTPHIAALIDTFEEKAKLPSTTPLFFVGMSQGGGAAPIIGAELARAGRPVRAIGIYCAGGSTVFDHAEYMLPTIFSLMANDTVMTARADVEANAAKLKARDVPVDLAVNEAHALCPTSLARIPGLGADAARAIFTELQGAGVLDESGRVVDFARTTDSGASPPVPGLDPQYASFERAVREQLWVAKADHAFFGARNEATVSFFDAHR